MDLSTLIEEIPRIGPQYQKRLKKLGIKTVRDLLYHFPHRYEDFSNIVPISKIKLGQICCVQGRILEIENTKTWKKRMILTEAIVEDESGAIRVVWFNQPFLINVLKSGDFVCLAGKIALGGPTKGGYSGLYLSNPAYEKISKDKTLIHTGRIIPVYPETERLSSRWLRFILRPLLKKFSKKIPELLPLKIIKKLKILPIEKAFWQIHFPDSITLAKKAQERFSFEELFLISLFVLREKMKIAKEKAIPIPINLQLIRNFVKSLPFKLTDAQKKSAWQILKDLEKERPMNRLLEGDVGSGKTVVATLVALNVTEAGFQTAFMAPTEILAQQHFKTISGLFKKFNVRTSLLTGKESKILFKNRVNKISKEDLHKKIIKNEVDILIGTHALIQERVKFEKLAFVIVDEQHRFGVEQRAHLCQPSRDRRGTGEGQSPIPHLLSMTATPIPRTLSLTIYGDLDLSLLDELPKGRKKIITKIISPKDRLKAYQFIRNEVKNGRQVFVICPRIEPTNNQQLKTKNLMSWAEVKAVKEEYNKLSRIIFPDLKLAMLHGKIPTQEKEKIMSDFKNKKVDILVSTSVVEVGVDIPNATVIMIEGVERFGLAQLHQFRGRVGRRGYQSYCLLFTESPAQKTKKRLEALITSENGFELAEKDLKIRGPGDFFGQRQWGIPDIAMLALKDIFSVERARKAAREILEEEPELKKYPLLRERVEKFRERIHLE